MGTRRFANSLSMGNLTSSNSNTNMYSHLGTRKNSNSQTFAYLGSSKLIALIVLEYEEVKELEGTNQI